MTIEQWPLTKLIPDARNPRRNQDAIKRMAASICEFGFKIPILCTRGKPPFRVTNLSHFASAFWKVEQGAGKVPGALEWLGHHPQVVDSRSDQARPKNKVRRNEDVLPARVTGSIDN
jgi:hypothetical protein